MNRFCPQCGVDIRDMEDRYRFSNKIPTVYFCTDKCRKEYGKESVLEEFEDE